MRFLQKYYLPFTLFSSSTFLYLFFAYSHIREDFLQLITLVSALFISTFFVLKYFKPHTKSLFGIGVIFRILFLVATPNLSQDFYRFIWDGHLVLQGVSPYAFTVTQWFNNPVQAINISAEYANLLYEGMGALNAGHYSNYPPLNQFCFALGALFGGQSILGSVITLRVLIIAADIGIYFYGKKLLNKFNLPESNIFWYFLNPFIIIELTGNLHFEGVMIFFVVASLYYLYQKKWIVASILWGCSISLKLLPLLLLPLFLRYFLKPTPYHSERSEESIYKNENSSLFNFKKYLNRFGITKQNLLILTGFYTLALLAFLISFIPFITQDFIAHFGASIQLWFQKFEFNASIYYLIRWVGYKVVGYNIIETTGKILPLVVFVIILVLSFFRKHFTLPQLIKGMLWASFVYFLLSTTVHPWYVATPLLLSVFTNYKFVVVWSATVFLSYFAYSNPNFNEHFGLLALEYTIFILVFILEIFNFNLKKHLPQLQNT